MELKKLSKEGIPGALAKAERYRLLAQPVVAESICRDILIADAANQQALITLLLSLTDQFGQTGRGGLTAARDVALQLADEYSRRYYQGIAHERQALTQLHKRMPDSKFIAHDLFIEAMDWYEKAREIHPAGNDEAILHWNVCARMIALHGLTHGPAHGSGEVFGDF